MKIIPLLSAAPAVISTLADYWKRGRIEPYSLSLDITAKCNLRCTHCYLYKQETEQWEMNQIPEDSHGHKYGLIKQIKEQHPRIVHSTLVGGEPLMPRVAEPLTRRITSMFPLNWVVTNGTFSIPEDYDNGISLTTFILSVDGIEEHHDAMRGKGVFRRAMDHVEESTARVYAHSVVTRETQEDLGKLVKRLKQDTGLRGIRFSIYTPEMGEQSSLELSFSERDNLVRQMQKLKRTYEEFIWMTPTEIDCFASHNLESVFGKNCHLLRGATLSLDYKGDKKEKCVMGPQTDCYRCGCTVPTITHAILEKKSLPTLWQVMKTFM